MEKKPQPGKQPLAVMSVDMKVKPFSQRGSDEKLRRQQNFLTSICCQQNSTSECSAEESNSGLTTQSAPQGSSTRQVMHLWLETSSFPCLHSLLLSRSAHVSCHTQVQLSHIVFGRPIKRDSEVLFFCEILICSSRPSSLPQTIVEKACFHPFPSVIDTKGTLTTQRV